MPTPLLPGLSGAILILTVMVLLSLAVLGILYARNATMARCLLTGRPTRHTQSLQLKGRCYELRTCSTDCHAILQDQERDDSSAFHAYYGVAEVDPASVRLSNPTVAAWQTIREVSCSKLTSD